MKPRLSSVELYVDAHGYWRADITDTARRERGDGVMGEVKAGDLVFWMKCRNNGVLTAQEWIEGEELPDSAQLPEVARRLAEAGQRGEDVRVVVASRHGLQMLVRHMGGDRSMMTWSDDDVDAFNEAYNAIREQIGGGA